MSAAASDTPSSLERLVQRDQLVALAALVVVTVLAWIYLAREAAGMRAMAMDARMHAAMGMADMRSWGLADAFGLFVMWAVMMVGMMLPSAAPMILLSLTVYRRRGGRHARISSFAFVIGYLVVWTMFSAAAAAAQTALHRAAVLTPEMASGSAVLAGVILLVAGVYQWLPIKNTCLTYCQSPLGFLTRFWREGVGGAFGMGVRHGFFCVGCCGALMALLFVVGVMNLVWVATIAAFVLLEKLVSRGPYLRRAAGGLLVAWGTYVLIRPMIGS